MTKTRLFSQSFAGGELSAEMQGHIGDPKYRSGVARLRNMVAKPTGSATKRPGFGHVAETKESGDRRSCIRGFTFSSTDTTVIEFGHLYFRFYTEGAQLLYATPRTMLSIDTGANSITFTEPHGFSNETAVQFTADSSNNADLPAPLVAGTTYYVTVVNTTTITVSATTPAGAAVNLTNDGTGTIRCWLDSEMPPDYEHNTHDFAPGDINIGLDNFIVLTHGYETGDSVRISTTGTMPAPLVAFVVYYIIKITANEFKLAYTREQALAGTPINITDQGSGGGNPHTIKNKYLQGDMVFSSSGGTHGVFYCKTEVSGGTTAPQADPTFWYQEPVDGIYEVPSPYDEDHIFDIDRDQSLDILYLAHPSYDFGQLRREGAIRWVFKQTSDFGPTIEPPINVAVTRTFGAYQEFTANGATPTLFTTVGGQTSGVGHGFAIGDTVFVESASGGIGGGGTFNGIAAGAFEVSHIGAPVSGSTIIDLRIKRTLTGGAVISSVSVNVLMRYVSLSADNDNTYVVTAVTEAGDESEASAEVTATFNNLTVNGSFNTLSWSATNGATRYRIYKKRQGLMQYIGETEDLTFKDTNLGPSPDVIVVPPRADTELSGTKRPAAVGSFEQRRALSLEQEVWLTATGTELSLTFHLPLVDTDRINFTVAAGEACPIQHIVELGNLLLMTSVAEFVVTPVNQDAITPTSKRARATTYIGSSKVKPLLINNTLLFPAARGGHIFEFGRSQESGYAANDVSIRAAHLFDNLTIVDSARMKSPYPIEWWVSSNGILLGFTYAPEEGIGGWHWHDTDGVIESCCVVAEGTEDVLYLVVLREIDGVERRFIERMGQFAVSALEDCFHVDAGLTYEGAAATTISGLGHLEGKAVQVFANGVVRDPEVVDSAAIVLATSTTKAHIGLPYDAELRTLPIVASLDQAFGKGRSKNVNRMYLQVQNSCRFQVGTRLNELAPATDVPTTGFAQQSEVDVGVPGDWTTGGQVYIVQSQPVPLTVIALCAEVSIG